MGQCVGKAKFIDPVEPFLNLDKHSIFQLWEAFNDVAEGFGINVDELTEICMVLQPTMGMVTKQVITKSAEAAFLAFDTDENLLVDALEILVTFCIVSGMRAREKAEFCFTCYDFDESGQITMDELTLLFKSCVSGLTKVSGLAVPDEAVLEQYAQDAFRKTGRNDISKITRAEYIDYVMSNPEIVSWVNFYDDSSTESAHKTGTRQVFKDASAAEITYDSDIEDEGTLKVRSYYYMKGTNPDFDESAIQRDAKIDLDEQKITQSYTRRPWLGTVEHTISTLDENAINPGIPDSDALELEWIHGYRAQDVRSNLLYTVGEDLVYMAATVAVVYNVNFNEQRFFLGHTEEILSLALHPNRTIVATGDGAGAEPKILVWDSSSMKLLAVLQGFHVGGVCQLAFSPNGKYLLSVGMDIDHSVVVYDWKANHVVFASKASREKILDCCFRTDSSFVTCGENHIDFWDKDGAEGTESTSISSFKKKAGVFGRLGKPQTMVSLANLKDGRLISGSMSGHLYIWDEGRNLKRTIKAHAGPVNSIFSCEHGLLSGSKDGKIRLWSPTMDPGATFDISGVGSLIPVIKSICWSTNGKKLLVGTKASEIYEISANDGSNLHPGPLIQGHCAYELRGLSTHPSKAEYCTVGDDQTLRVWDIATRRMIKMVRFDAMARSCCYTPDGSKIVVGLGGKVKHPRAPKGKKDGAFAVLLESDLTICHEARDSKQWIADVKVSPDGNTLALGSKDKFIYLYNMDDFASKGKCKGHAAGIRHLDFSGDNQSIQSNCDGYELLYWNANTGEQHKHASAMKDSEWYSQNCTFGWNVQGTWPKKDSYDGTEVTTTERSFTGTVLASGDSFGRIRLYRFPTVGRVIPASNGDSKYNVAPSFNEYRGHAMDVAAVRFGIDDTHLISIGTQDRCVFQWRHLVDEVEDDAEEFRQEWDSEDEDDMKDGFKDWGRSDEQEDANLDLTNLKNLSLEDDDDDDEDVVADKKKQIAATRPWVSSITPPSEPPKESLLEAPKQCFTLDRVHGFRGHDTRNIAEYLANGDIVYPAANLGIVFTARGGGVQRFFTDHTDEVISLAVHPEGRYVATGQVGRYPKVIIWDSETLEVVKTLQGFHKWAIPHVRFSRDGTQLVTCGADDNHSLAVYDWEHAIILASCKGGIEKVMAVDFTPDGAGVVQCGVDHVKFHEIQGRNFSTKSAILGKKGRKQVNLCIAWVGNRPVIGTLDGHLYGFQGRTLMQSTKAHRGSVNCMHSCSAGIVSGGKDGTIKLWSPALECKAEFNLASVSINFPDASVRSVCWNVDDNRILVGTRACEIFEISATDGTNVHGQDSGPLVQGHNRHELWGLAIHPFKKEYCTVGDDQTVRVWNIETRKMVKFVKLDTMARSCAYSVDGSKIAVGLGGKSGRGKQKRDGAFMVLSEKDLSVIHEGRDSKYWISDVKFSPDGSTLALASQDNKVYLYDVAGGYLVKGTMDGHNSFLTHFDFSSDSQYMQSTCGAFELVFSDARSGERITAVSKMKDVEWATHTCPLGWAVQGLHDISGTKLDPTKSSSESNTNAVHRSANGQLLAVGDEFGRVHVLRFPVLTFGKGAFTAKGHSAHITNVRFLSDDSYLVTVGGTDRCVFQWRVEDGDEDEAVVAGDSGNDSDIVVEGDNLKLSLKNDSEFIPVKPWISSVVAPSMAVHENTSVPDLDMELDFVYGYSAQNCRNNLRYNRIGNMVYFAASIGVIYDKRTHSQNFFLGHDNDITCMAIDSSRTFVATGQRGKSPLVHIWNSMTGQLVKTLSPFHTPGAITLLAFSRDGKQLLSVGNDENHTLGVWKSDLGNWLDGHLQASAMGGKQKVLFAEFFAQGGTFKFATGGSHHVKFWSQSGRLLQIKDGMFGRKGKVQPMPCAALVRNMLVTGTVSGHFYVWEGVQCVKSIKAHEKTVNAVHACASGLVSGSKDGIVKIWDTKLVPLRTFNLTEAKPVPYRCSIRSVCWDDQRGLLLVGTQGSEIYEITVDNQAVTLVNQGHCVDELWGLDTHPTDPSLFVTSGDDATIRVWNLRDKKLVNKKKVDCMTRSISWSPDGKQLGVGLGGNVGRGRQKKDGAFMVLDSEDFSVIHEARDSREWITDTKYSPDGKTFAVASRDNKIYLYDAENRMQLRAKCEKHNSFITHFDFSTDSEYIRSNCGGYELLYFKVSDGTHINSPSVLRDVEWETVTCTLGWSVKGLWPEYDDGVVYNACDRSHNKTALVSADDIGQVRVFRFPCNGNEPESVDSPVVHSSQAASVRFNSDDSYIVSIGGNDRCVCQWKVTWKGDAK